jgi:VanZ family protein
MKKINKITDSWFGWMLLTVLLGAIFILTFFQTFTGEHTKYVIQHMMGITENKAYLINAVARKSVHILTFGFLGILFYVVTRRRSIIFAWCCATLVAGLDEWHQSFVPGRTPLLEDVMLDSLAAIFFLMIFAYSRRK